MSVLKYNYFGILAIAFSLLALFTLNWLLAIIAIVFSIAGLLKDKDKSISTIMLALSIIILLVMPSKHSNTEDDTVITHYSANNYTKLNQDQIDHMKLFEKQGLIRFERGTNDVFISTELWEGMDYNTKENFSAGIASYEAQILNYESASVYLRDKMSGKRLASYQWGWGFKME